MSTLSRAAAPEGFLQQANDAALLAAHRAGVVISPLHEVREQAEAAALAARVWRSADTSALDPSVMRVLAHTGNFVCGAFAGNELVGMSVGFRTGTPRDGLHSHMTCTTESRRGAGLGHALKLHQRAWALAEGLTTITWTFDPLVSRNAYFNLAKLGAVVTEYLPNFYGQMNDGLNAGDESDRLLVSWDVTADVGPGPVEGFPATGDQLLVSVSPDEAPVVAASTGQRVACQVPSDIVSLRDHDPALALTWRQALRTALRGAFDDGYRITGFTRTGCYVLSRAVPDGETAAGDR